MPRIARVVAEGLPHHITQRGNRKMKVFRDDNDREIYLRLLRKFSIEYSLEILAYCLMSNHVHLVAIPEEIQSLSRTIAQTHMRYSKYFNQKYSESGHLWHSRFFSCVLDESHTIAAARYIERNPARAGLVSQPRDYRWSSARGHLGEVKDPILSKTWPSGSLLLQWHDLISEDGDGRQTENIRSATRAGRPLGAISFIDELEHVLGRSLQHRKPGRPPKKCHQ
jgi:putative transposase